MSASLEYFKVWGFLSHRQTIRNIIFIRLRNIILSLDEVDPQDQNEYLVEKLQKSAETCRIEDPRHQKSIF